MKLARHATGRPNVIVVQGGFHGRTYLTMAMTTSKVGVRAGYQPLPAGDLRDAVPAPVRLGRRRGDRGRARRSPTSRLLLQTQTAPSETAAFVMEPVLGEGGYLPAPIAFVRGVHEICAEHGILFVADEVQTGFARTGRMFAVEHAARGARHHGDGEGHRVGLPDRGDRRPRRADGPLEPGRARRHLRREPDGLRGRARDHRRDPRRGARRPDRRHAAGNSSTVCRSCSRSIPGIGDVRGLGLMVAAELTQADGSPDRGAHERGDGALPARRTTSCFMSCGADGNVIRFMPPLVVSEDEINQALAAFDAALAATASG